MVEYNPDTLDRTFAALSDPTRRDILARLSRGEACVTDLAAPHAMSLAAVSKHLVVLERAGLVRRTRLGRTHRLSLEAGPMRLAQTWIADYRRFWEQQIDQFESYLNQIHPSSTENESHERPDETR